MLGIRPAKPPDPGGVTVLLCGRLRWQVCPLGGDTHRRRYSPRPSMCADGPRVSCSGRPVRTFSALYSPSSRPRIWKPAVVSASPPVGSASDRLEPLVRMTGL